MTRPYSRLTWLLCLGLCLALAQCHEATLSEKLDEVAAPYAVDRGPGVALMVIKGGQIVHAKGYGLADIETGRRITPKSSFRMGSVSKQFTSMAVMLLAKDGKLSLDDPVRKYFDYPVYEGITLKHLLHHTSGLAEYFEVFEKTWDRSKIVTNPDLIGYYSTQNPEPFFRLGEKWKYSNAGYSLLASIVAQVSGQSFPGFVKKRIFEPLEMNHSVVFTLASPEPIPERVHCYTIKEDGTIKPVDGHYMNGIVGEGGVYTSLEDYYKWDQALYTDRLVAKKWIDEAFTPAVLNSGKKAVREESSYADLGYGPIGYGYGWGLGTKEGDRVTVHAGGWFGVSTLTIRHIDIPYSIVLFSNSDKIKMNELAKKVETVVRTAFALDSLPR